MKPQKIEISAKTIIFTVLFILSLGLLWQIRELIFSLFIAFIIAGALKPGVAFLETIRLPRAIASFIIYLLFIFIIYSIFSVIIPPLLSEMIFLSKNLPKITESILPHFGIAFNFDLLTQNIPTIANQTLGFVKGIFSNVVFVTSTLFFGFYFLLEKNLEDKLLCNFFEEIEIKKIEVVSNRAQKRMSSWFWGEVILMIVVGTMTYVGLNIIGMKYVLALAVLAGLLEVIPSLGPITSSIPAILIGLSYSPILGLYCAILYIVVQQLENNLLVPLVMKKVTGLHPIVTLVAMVIGGKLAGIMGVLLAVPSTMFIETILIESQKFSKK
ncbi:MAG: AI-2E family transporter [Patescibacteria group bacterium]|jgi:predicted PurR-regulated permease PerM